MNQEITVIVGLGNPGPRFLFNRHNSGFLILDALARRYNAQWHEKNNYLYATIPFAYYTIMLVKPYTFMNNSGAVFSALKKQGIQKENILVVHDELELPFGTIVFKFDGSARGHNGLKSIIQVIGKDFLRLRFGIGRPQHKEDVQHYVLEDFPDIQLLQTTIDTAVDVILKYVEESFNSENCDNG